MWRILGHKLLLRQLDSALAAGKLSHAYLIAGPPHSGKMTLAIDMACAANCLAEASRPCGECIQCRRVLTGQHTDVMVIVAPKEQSKRDISIDTVREVEHQASLMPFEGRYRVFVIEEADRMSEQAENALLKTLEEPPAHVLFLLTTAQEGRLLTTVRSRCQRLELRALPYEALASALARDHGLTEDDARRLARISRGCPGVAVQLASQPEAEARRAEAVERLAKLVEAGMAERFQFAGTLAATMSRDRQEVRETLYLWLQWWRDILLVGEGVPDSAQNLDRIDLLKAQARRFSKAQVAGSVRALMSTLDALEANASPRLALEAMMMALPLQRERQ